MTRARPFGNGPQAAQAIPASNIFSLVQISELLVEGLRAGSRLTSSMASPDVSIDEPLGPRDCAVDLVITDIRNEGGMEIVVTVQVRNRGYRALSSQGRFPVFVGVRQRCGSECTDVHRVHLPSAILPGRSAEITFTLPNLPGDDGVTNLCIVQEGVRWFDTVSPNASCDVALPDAEPIDIGFVLCVEHGQT